LAAEGTAVGAAVAWLVAAIGADVVGAVVADAEQAEREVASTATSAMAPGLIAPLPRVRPRMEILIRVSSCSLMR
jgi:hypothetical protein